MRRLLFLLFWLIELPLVVVGALLLVFWLWSGSDQSLASALAQAGRFLPAGQTLVAQDVRGSLRHGGTIGTLRWSKDSMALEARRIELTWSPASLLDRRLQLDTLHITELRIDYQSASAGPAALTDLVLPFEVDVAFAVDRLHWTGPPDLVASGLRGRYRFDSTRHVLRLDQAQVAAGSYQADATLLARAPLALDLQARGTVQAPLGATSIALDAVATLRGALAGPDMALDFTAAVQPPLARARAAARVPAQAMRANITAQIRPRAAQPVTRALASFEHLNLAALWSGAPQTLLTGNARVQPLGNNWQADLDLINRLPGPWDTDRLPVDNAKAKVQFADGSWNIESLDAAGAGGRVQVQGKLEGGAAVGAWSGWTGQAQLQAIDPARLHSRLPGARLDGAVQASAANAAIVFDAWLRQSGQLAAGSRLQAVGLQNASAKGRWADGWLQLHDLKVRTDDALLQGQLDLQPATSAVRGQLELIAPGAQAKASGALGPQAGAADLSLHLADIGNARRWLARMPMVPALLPQLDLQGRAELALRWQGGWLALQTARAAEPTVQLSLQVPQLELRWPGDAAAQTLRVRDFQGDLSGRLDALSAKAGGELLRGNQRASWQAQAHGGRTATGWQMALPALRMQLHDSLRPGPWTLALRQPLALDWQAAASGGNLRTSAGEADLAGPLPGVATLAWQPLRWAYGARNEFSSQGQLRGLSMAWLDLLGDTQLTSLGLSGNMVFDADWDLAAADTLRLRAALVRRSGDIRVLADNPGAQGPGANATIDAGVRDARISISADGNDLRASVRWDSERAGNAQAEFATRAGRGAGGWDWPADAPLIATVRARLPQVGVWSVLAPPGWRMRGTLDANMALAGTRQAPRWSGTLQADDLALRSVVDGIEFGNGRLRATLQGQRLEIDEFSLQGAGGAAGGTLFAKGFASWQPGPVAAGPSLARVRIELAATARALRVTARADRRLAVSGTAQARLDNNRLEIRGVLKADQALFILPDETTPALGDDVVVRRTGAASTALAGSTGPAGAVPPGSRVVTDLWVELDLGQDFRVQGRGINTRLAGTLQLRNTGIAGAAPRLSGEVRTVGGNYKAYGQQLEIEQGVLRFGGAFDNPALDILALRPNLSQRVGVQITGTALVPRVRLYADPELPEAEKLAWLVLGRSGANGGAEAAVLQQAALALLGRSGQGLSGGLAGALGLDELSFAAATSNAAGASAATVTLGKRLSKDFYVAYERSLAGTLGTISIFYDLSKRFTLRARTGEQSAVDLIFTLSYD